MKRKPKLLLFEVACIFWMAIAGSMLHFAFELSEFWKPMAFFAAVNESAWEHVKMYFWPGLFFGLAQYTYTRDIANNYWFGKALGLAVMPLSIFGLYFGYMLLVDALQLQPSLSIMISIMFLGIIAGQLTSYVVLTMPQLHFNTTRYAFGTYAALVLLFSSLTYFPPKAFLFEHFYCYTYTGEFGILEDYEPYRVFGRMGPDGQPATAANVNYCADVGDSPEFTTATAR